MAFSDRVVQYPNRWKLTTVSGTSVSGVYTVEREEGEVENVGTPLNADSLNTEVRAAVAEALAALDIDSNDNVHVQNIQCGRVQVTVKEADTTYTKSVTFSQPFTSVPRVVTTPMTSVPEKVSIGITDVTTSGFSITLNRTSAVNTSVNWIAMI